MREIKFRGKTKRGEWVVGFYWSNLLGNHFIKKVVDERNYFITEDVEIVAETVGQFIGLLDKNGKEIYEGDICRWKFKRPWKEECHVSEVIWRELNGAWRLNTAGDTTKMRQDIQYEVIGNIHENPELLEG